MLNPRGCDPPVPSYMNPGPPRTIPLKPYTPLVPGHAAAEAFFNIMTQRRSIRSFADKPVPIETIEWCVRAAGSAPSGANKQPWRFVVTDRQRTPEAFDAMLASLSPRNASWARFAPVLALVAVRHSLERNGAATLAIGRPQVHLVMPQGLGSQQEWKPSLRISCARGRRRRTWPCATIVDSMWPTTRCRAEW